MMSDRPPKSGSRWHDYVSRRLAQLRCGEGDFTGLQQPTAGVIDRAQNVAAELFQAQTATPSVVPSEDGEVLFVWRRAGWDLEIAVGADDVTVWAYERSSGDVWSGSLIELRHRLVALLVHISRDGST
jgi:hypothetical protein